MGFKNAVRRWRNRNTIRMQLGLVMALLVAITIGFIIMYNYSSQTKANSLQQSAALGRVLALENERLDGFIDEIKDYSLLLRADQVFMSLIASQLPLSYAERLQLENSFRTLFYARNDISSMEMYILRQNSLMTIDAQKRKASYREGVRPETLNDYAIFTSPPEYLSIQSDPDGFLIVSRTIIDSPYQTPLAVVRFRVAPSEISALKESHDTQHERLFLFDREGLEYDRDLSFDDGEQVWQALSRGDSQITINDDSCLLMASRPGRSGFVMAVVKPMSIVNEAIIHASGASLVFGLAALALTVFLALWAIRVLTSPLSSLAKRMQGIGSGDFEVKADLQGSFEMIGLSEEVNHMTENISGLINRTYVATLNERTAQLAALEAQTNPHFLFNTLQAISTEAIMEGNNNVYRMVTALAALLRYSIKGGNLVPLGVDLEYVEKYLMLQKTRFGERLDYTLHADDALTDYNAPKLGILALVENSIVHGMVGKAGRLNLVIECRVVDACACLSVWDDGMGIDKERLGELNRILNDDGILMSGNIGLGNLASRLRLLYGSAAKLLIESKQDEPRHTKVTMMIPMEVFANVASADS